MSKETFLTEFFKGLSNKNIDYFVFGEYSQLPHDTGGSDIDILLGNNQLVVVDKLILELIHTHQACLGSFFLNSNAHYYRIITSSWGVQIDILEGGFKYNGIDYYPLALLKEHLIDHNGITVLDIKYGYYFGYLKEIIHNGTAKEKYIKGFISVIDNDKSFYQKEIETLYGKNPWCLISSNYTIAGLCHIGQELRLEMLKFISEHKKFKMFFTKIRKLNRFIQKRPGYLIAIEGTDGAGKSALISKITPILDECFHHSVIYCHLRPRFIPDISVLFNKRSTIEANKICTEPHKKKPSGLLGSLVRWLYYLLDYTFGYLIKVWPQIHKRSNVFLFDRYYYDYYIDAKRFRVRLPKMIIRFGEMFVSKPDLILCLGGDPHIIFSRKPETSLEEVKRQIAELRSFCNSRDNTVWIDTTCNIDQTISNTMSAIVGMMKKRNFDKNLKC